MSSPRPFRLSVVYEFAGQPGDMMHDLLDNLATMVPGLRVRCLAGLFPTYRPGGLRAQRLVNLVWVYARVAVHLFFRRPDAVLVRSAPPGVQLWAIAWAAIGRIPVLCWLMDYHPELEARRLERRGHGRLARYLRAVDARLMPRFALVITLDPAMTALVRSRLSPERVLEHPTWGTNGTSDAAPVSYRPGAGEGPLRLAYSGNLGAAHDLEPLRRLLGTVARERPVHLFVIGASPAGETRFKELGEGLGLPVDVNPRVPFTDLRRLYEEHRIDAGIVLLSDESVGLVSPSKFSGYIDFGLPVVYLGPPGTNTATVCTRFQGGFWLPTGAGPDETGKVASGLLDGRQMDAAAAGARAASAYFAGFNGRSLAGALASRLRKLG